MIESFISRAYLAVLGRAPERAGLQYWSKVPACSTQAGAVEAIVAAVAGSNVYDASPYGVARMLHWHLLGQTPEDKQSSATQTEAALKLQSIGNVAASLMMQSTAVMAARFAFLESIRSSQAAALKDLDFQDSRSLIQSVDSSPGSIDRASKELQRCLASIGPTPLTWQEPWTPQMLWERSVSRQVRGVFWYNRSGRLMRATIYLPQNFRAQSNQAVIAVHGGGWRHGFPENVEWLSAGLAQRGNFVVVAPNYRLTAFGAKSPDQENDIEDMVDLVRRSPFLQCDRVALAGESAGGHLAALVGNRKQALAFALYPPCDLVNVSQGLEPYIQQYTQNRASVSLRTGWNAGSKLMICHGSRDALVPPDQSRLFQRISGCDLFEFGDQGHGFDAASRERCLSSAVSWLLS